MNIREINGVIEIDYVPVAKITAPEHHRAYVVDALVNGDGRLTDCFNDGYDQGYEDRRYQVVEGLIPHLKKMIANGDLSQEQAESIRNAAGV